MAIERAQPTSQIVSLSQRDIRLPGKTQPMTAEQGKGSQKGSTVKISADAINIMHDTSQDVDMERIENTTQAVAAGTYCIDSDKIAEAMLRDVY